MRDVGEHAPPAFRFRSSKIRIRLFPLHAVKTRFLLQSRFERTEFSFVLKKSQFSAGWRSVNAAVQERRLYGRIGFRLQKET
jgi:hypothetical protein